MMTVLPLKPGSPQPKSSAIHRMTFGLSQRSRPCRHHVGSSAAQAPPAIVRRTALRPIIMRLLTMPPRPIRLSTRNPTEGHPMSHGRHCPGNQADWQTIAYRGQTREPGPPSSTRDASCRIGSSVLLSLPRILLVSPSKIIAETIPTLPCRAWQRVPAAVATGTEQTRVRGRLGRVAGLVCTVRRQSRSAGGFLSGPLIRSMASLSTALKPAELPNEKMACSGLEPTIKKGRR